MKNAGHKQFSIFTSDGRRVTIEASNLRKALRAFDGDQSTIVAAIEADCLPVPTQQAGPFLAVILKNPLFIVPEIPE